VPASSTTPCALWVPPQAVSSLHAPESCVPVLLAKATVVSKADPKVLAQTTSRRVRVKL
jgi:hypothetical protein